MYYSLPGTRTITGVLNSGIDIIDWGFSGNELIVEIRKTDKQKFERFLYDNCYVAAFECNSNGMILNSK
jgi:hypothetical protein